MNIGQAFDNTVDYYDEWMQKALPNFHDLFSSAVSIIPYKNKRQLDVLDLGAGTGLFSSFVLKKYPNAHFDLFDLGEKMLETAQKRFKPFPDQFKYIIGDYRQLSRNTKYDLVISSLSIHHLNDEEKQKLFIDIFHVLNHSGLFINIDQIRGETQKLREIYWEHYLNQVNHSGASKEQIENSIQRRTTYDKDALLSDQLQWLKNAGFNHVDCIYKNFFVGVFIGIKE